jgi:hypothetical protein
MSLIRINRQPSRSQLLVFGLAWLVFFGALGATLWLRGRTVPATVAAALAAGVPLAGIFLPRMLRHLYVGLSYAVYPIGFVVSHVILAVLYYLVVTPIGLVLRLGGYDPLARRPAPGASSYWRDRGAPKPAASYFRQH